MSDATFVNLYETLGLQRDASPEQIQLAVKDARKIWVLRQNAPSLERRQEAETMLARVAEAERVLLNSDLRTTFDQQLQIRGQTSGNPAFYGTPEREANWAFRNFEQVPHRRQQMNHYPDTHTPAQAAGYPTPASYPRGRLILFLGIGGLFCGILAPVAWILGNQALKEVRASGVHPSDEQQIRTGRMLGIIFTALMVLLPFLSLMMLSGTG